MIDQQRWRRRLQPAGRLEAGNQKVNLLNGLFSIDPKCDGLRTSPKPSKYFP
jgi:hypothetical protein